MKKGTILGSLVGAALLTAAPFSLQWSQKTVKLSLDSADARIGRPLTPLSVAGVHRRAHRRAVYGTAAAIGVGSDYGRYGYPSYGNGSYYASAGYPGYSYGSYGYPSYGYGSYTPPAIQAMAMGATTGRAIGLPAEWRSIAPAGTEARA